MEKAKKYSRIIFSILCTLILSVSMTSCNDDDDDDGGNSKSPIVGTWVGYEEDHSDGDYGDELVTMTFTADGKMTAKGELNGVVVWRFSGTYKTQNYDNSSQSVMTISIGGYFEGDDEYYDDDISYRPCYINGNELSIFFDGTDYVLKKQGSSNGGSSSDNVSSLIGSWQHSGYLEGEGYVTTKITFSSNGTCQIKETSEGETYSVTLNYTLTGNLSSGAVLKMWGRSVDGDNVSNTYNAVIRGGKLCLEGIAGEATGDYLEFSRI